MPLFLISLPFIFKLLTQLQSEVPNHPTAHCMAFSTYWSGQERHWKMPLRILKCYRALGLVVVNGESYLSCT